MKLEVQVRKIASAVSRHFRILTVYIHWTETVDRNGGMCSSCRMKARHFSAVKVLLLIELVM